MNVSDWIKPAVKSLAESMEGEVRAAVEHFMGDNFTLEEVRSRCRFVRFPGQPGELLQIDGKDALVVYEPEISYEQRDQSLVYRLERKYRRLWTPAVVAASVSEGEKQP